MLEVPPEYDLLNKLALNAQDIRADEYTRRLPTRGERQIYEFDQALSDQRNIKAELVRRNLLSRKDLMNLYKPPVQPSSLPTNNPWVTRSILQPTFSTYTQARCGTTQSPRSFSIRDGTRRRVLQSLRVTPMTQQGGRYANFHPFIM